MEEQLYLSMERLWSALREVREQILAQSPKPPKDRVAHQAALHRELAHWGQRVSREQLELAKVLELEAGLRQRR